MLYNDKYDGISTQNIGIDSLIRLFNEKKRKKKTKQMKYFEIENTF